MREKYISSSDNRPTDTGGRDAMSHEGNEDMKGKKNVGFGLRS